MSYVLILLFAGAHGYMQAAPVPGLFAEKANCETAGEQWKREASDGRWKQGNKYTNIGGANYICLPR